MKPSKKTTNKHIAITSEGGAFFIDILGVSDLTRGKIPISPDSISEIVGLSSVPKKSIHQYLSVYLLSAIGSGQANHLKR